MSPLLADIQDILGAIVPVLFVVFWVISQVIAGINKARRGQVAPPQESPPQNIPPSPEEDALSKEIERFLGQKREPARPQEQLPRPAESVITAEVTRPSTLDSTTEPPPRQPLPSASGNRPDRGVRRRKSSKKKTVASTGQSFGSTFAKQERQSDGLQQLTNIAGNIPAPATMTTGARQDDGILELPDNVATDANPWQTMISDPTTLRQAFLLSQIFSRPEDRW